MSVIKQIAFYQGRRDEVPNQELARRLARTGNTAGIREIADNLRGGSSNVRSDCLKVLYEIGYLKPGLIAPFVNDFLALLDDRNNRMVWGAMIAVATIADLAHAQVWRGRERVLAAVDSGTLITLVWGIRAIARAASHGRGRRDAVLPRLREYLRSCNARDVPTHLESMLPIIDETTWPSLEKIVNARKAEMTPSHLARLKKVLRRIPPG